VIIEQEIYKEMLGYINNNQFASKYTERVNHKEKPEDNSSFSFKHYSP
jgi:hypothetical protein